MDSALVRQDQDHQRPKINPEPFQYQPLAEGEIRLLKFHPEDIYLDMKIHDNAKNTTTKESFVLSLCELICTTIEGAPPYVALSYAWGDPTLIRYIIVNNRPFLVAKNLFDFLSIVGRHYLDHNLMLWVDAICIDQSNFPERSMQVLQMARIYDHAHQVHAWLGPGTPETNSTVKNIHSMFTMMADLIAKHKGDIPTAFEEVNPRNTSLYNVSEAQDLQKWKSIFELFNVAWWTRAWVVQEATSKAALWMFAGSSLIEFRGIEFTMGILQELERYPEFVRKMGRGHADNVFSMFEIREKRKRRSLRLLDLLSLLYKYGCADPRDKVYAGLAIGLDVGDSITPDYRRSVPEVYGDVVRFCLANEDPYHRLDFLGHVLLQEEPIDEPTPSWVPDWRRTRRLHPFAKYFHPYRHMHPLENQSYSSVQEANAAFLKAHTESKQEEIEAGKNKDRPSRVYCASGDSQPDVRIDGAKMYIKGFQFDTIRVLSQADKDEHDRTFVKYWIPRRVPSGTDDAIQQLINSDRWQAACLQTIIADVATADGEPVQRGHSIGSWVLQDDWEDVTDVDLMRYRASEFHTMKYATLQRRFCFTSNLYMGLAPAAAKVGDVVCIFFGGQVPYVIRKKQGSEEFEFIGECYLNGLMDGGLMKGAFNNGKPYSEREFVLA